MICPKCKGEVIEIRGNYFCAQCGTRVDLESVKKEIETEMTSVQGESSQGAVDQKKMEEQLNVQQSESALGEAKKEESAEAIPQEAVQSEETQPQTDNQETAQSTAEESATPSFSHNKPDESIVDPSGTSKIPAPSASPAKKNILHYDNIKTLLIVVIILNILIIAGLIYFFVIK